MGLSVSGIHPVLSLVRPSASPFILSGILLTVCNSIDRHRGAIQAQKISQVRRWDKDDWKDYPYRSHGQPFVAYLALAGCLAVIVVANGAALWNGFEKMPFLSSYLIVGRAGKQ